MLYESEYFGVLNIPAEGYLQHHGIKGQKWGNRRFQYEDNTLTPAGKDRYGTGTSLDTGHSNERKPSRRSIAKDLNRSEKSAARQKYEIQKRQDRIDKSQKKIDKINARASKHDKQLSGRQARKVEKLQNQISKQKSEKKTYEQNKKQIDAHVKQRISEAIKAGYNVQSKTIMRDTHEGRHIAAGMLFGYGAAAASMAADRKSIVESKRYKVSKTKNGEKASYQHKDLKRSKTATRAATIVKANAARQSVEALTGTGYILYALLSDNSKHH